MSILDEADRRLIGTDGVAALAWGGGLEELLALSKLGHTIYVNPLSIITPLCLLLTKLLYHAEMGLLGRRLERGPSL